MQDAPTSVSLHTLVALRRKADSLNLLSGAIRSHLAGGHLSRLRGRGMEFDEVRRYQSGDDARVIDWKVTARKGVPYIKLFREERERPVLLAIDYRRAMFFATRGAFKSVRATTIAALYGWAGIAHGDRVGGLIFDERQCWQQKPGRGHKALLRLLHRCCNHAAWHGEKATATAPSMEAILTQLRKLTPTGSLIVFISDGRGINAACRPRLAALARHNAVILLRIRDPLEQQLPTGGLYPVRDGARTLLFDGGDQRWRQRYETARKRDDETLRDLCRGLGVHLVELSTTDDPLRVLAQPNA